MDCIEERRGKRRLLYHGDVALHVGWVAAADDRVIRLAGEAVGAVDELALAPEVLIHVAVPVGVGVLVGAPGAVEDGTLGDEAQAPFSRFVEKLIAGSLINEVEARLQGVKDATLRCP